MEKEDEIMNYMHYYIFDPVLTSKFASETTKKGVRYTIIRLNQRDANGMVKYFWSAIVGTEKSIPFLEYLRSEGFNRFEDVIEGFRVRFDDKWLNNI